MALRQFESLEERKVLNDVVFYEVDSRFTREVLAIENGDAGEIDIVDPEGYPYYVDTADSNTLKYLIAGKEADVAGVIIMTDEKSITIAAGDNLTHTVINRGPAILRRSGIPTADYADAALDVDAIAAALLANCNIRVINEGVDAVEGTW